MSASEHIVTLTDSNFSAEVMESSLPVLVDFWAPWCGPCLMVGPTIEEIAKERAGSLKVGKVNVDDNPQTAQQFAIRSIPTLLFFKDGKLADQIIGASSKKAILQKVDKLS